MCTKICGSLTYCLGAVFGLTHQTGGEPHQKNIELQGKLIKPSSHFSPGS